MSENVRLQRMRDGRENYIYQHRRRIIRPRDLFLYGALTGFFLCLPLLLPPFSLLLLCYALVFAIACLGLNLLLGHTGLLSLGHAAYFGVGAYAGGFLYTFTPMHALEGYLAAGIVAAVALAALFGLLCVQASRIHFTILTLAFAQMLHALFISGAVFKPAGAVGKGLFLLGGGGLYIPRLTILGQEFPPLVFIKVLYYVILLALMLSCLLLWRLMHSPFGKALQAIRESDTRAAFIGIRVRRYRWYAFVISAGFTGLAGGLFGQIGRQITPEQLHWVLSAQLVLATVLGGMGQFWGPVVGAFVFVALDELATRWGLYRGFVLGGLLIAVVFVFPRGIAGSIVACFALRRRPDTA